MIRVFSGIVPARIVTLFLSESLLIFGCYLAAAWWDPDLDDPGIFLLYEAGLVRIALVAGLILLGFYFRDFYAQMRIRSRVLLFQELCMIFGAAFIGQGLLTYVQRDWSVPRKIMLLGSVLALLCIFGWRLLFDIAARGAVEARRVLFLGMSPTVMQLAGYFKLHPEFGFTPVGYLDNNRDARSVVRRAPDDLPDDAPDPDSPAAMLRLGSVGDLRNVLDATRPGSVVIGRREDIKPWWTNDFLELRFSGVQAEQAATLYESTFGRVCSAEIWPSKVIFGGTWRVRSSAVKLQNLYSPALAIVAIAVTAPLMALIALLIKLTSAGPALLRETRTGLHETPFARYRFRCRSGLSGTGPFTPLGRFLHRFALDVLPEFFNVLTGNMTVVGPEADRPEFARKLSEEIPFYRQRYQVKPGLTGWAQVHFDSAGSELDAIRRLEYDLYYVKKLSPALDSFVLMLSFRTLRLRRRIRSRMAFDAI